MQSQDTFRPIPGLINCAGVTGGWGLLFMHRMHSDGWAYSKVSRDFSKAPSLHAAIFRS